MAPSISSTTACAAAATSLANKGTPTMAANSARANRLRAVSIRRAQAAVSAAPMGRLLVARRTDSGITCGLPWQQFGRRRRPGTRCGGPSIFTRAAELRKTFLQMLGQERQAEEIGGGALA